METAAAAARQTKMRAFRSPFGGIPRNWKLVIILTASYPDQVWGSPFGGIPRNWKLNRPVVGYHSTPQQNVPPSGGSLEIGNCPPSACSTLRSADSRVPPSGGSLEIGNASTSTKRVSGNTLCVPPSGGSLEIGNIKLGTPATSHSIGWVPPSGGSLEIGNEATIPPAIRPVDSSPFGGIPRNWKQ